MHGANRGKAGYMVRARTTDIPPEVQPPVGQTDIGESSSLDGD